MANITSVNNYSKNNNLTSTKKISFDVGEVFSAQILGGDTDSNEVVLRTSDGWKFNAKVENFNQIDNFSGSAKFVVDGVKDGKIIIKLLDAQEKKSDAQQVINDELLTELGLADTEENVALLKALIQHNMPLTKENISKMKTIVDFKKDLNDNPNKADEFIIKFLQNKNINVKSDEGQAIYSKLKDFFGELKNLSSEDILTFFENKIDLNKENIESFNKLFKSQSSLYEELENINKLVNEHNLKSENNVKNENTAKDIFEAIKNHNGKIETDTSKSTADIKPNLTIDKGESPKSMNSEEIIKLINESGKNISEDKKSNLINNIKVLDDLTKIVESSNNEHKAIFSSDNEEVVSKIKNYILENADDLQNVDSKHVIKGLMSKIEPGLKLSSNDVNDILTSLQKLHVEVDNKNAVNQNGIKNSENNAKIDEAANLIKNLVNSSNDNVEINSAQNVREQINIKMDNMKSFISNLIDVNKGDNSSLSQRIYNIIKDNINDFKVFNSVSNEYYYMDIPVTNNNNDYKCKLIIKDDRKSGKRVDSRNVKLVTSVKTVNMGTVDAYIRVLENNMNVNLKCEEQWVKTFNKSKDYIIGKISNMGYNISVNVDKRKDKEEVNIVNCRNFFNDNNSYGKIDVRV